jgi:uncharacterized membrane protein SpoIIM required for sporulation
MTMVALFAMAALGVRWGTALVRPDEEELQFEEEAAPAVQELGLHRDGVMPVGWPPAG